MCMINDEMWMAYECKDFTKDISYFSPGLCSILENNALVINLQKKNKKSANILHQTDKEVKKREVNKTHTVLNL